MTALLAVENLAVTYGSGVRAIKNASLVVQKGELVALLGSNGAGKTTLLRAIAGLLGHHNGRISGGRIVFSGQELNRLPGHQRSRLGMTQTFEGRRILLDFSVEENLYAGGLNVNNKDVKSRIAALYEKFPILERRRLQPAGLLSGGEQQILALARALIADPEVLLLDEPSLGLAPIMITQIANSIRTIRELGKTILLIEQNAHLALQMADRAYIMQNGEIITEGTAEKLKQQEVMQHFYMGIGEATLPIRQRKAQLPA